VTGIEGKVAIVTGAGSGMGKATALRFASEGAHVIAADITGAEEKTAAENPERITPVRCDVTREADVEQLVAQTVAAHGRLDVLCNVVGIAHIAEGLVGDLDMAEFDQIMAINLRSCVLGMKYGIPAIVASGGGSVINWASTAAFVTSAATGAYGATKAAVVAMTKAAARGYGVNKVRVNAICPGFTYPTGMTTTAEERAPDIIDRQLARAAIKDVAGPGDVANMAIFLASDESSHVTGTAMVVDGGLIAGT
jgi:NAD(P)-dependent dehydrogenase (short-subunit alcohol dehydrogenase family)